MVPILLVLGTILLAAFALRCGVAVTCNGLPESIRLSLTCVIMHFESSELGGGRMILVSLLPLYGAVLCFISGAWFQLR